MPCVPSGHGELGLGPSLPGVDEFECSGRSVGVVNKGWIPEDCSRVGISKNMLATKPFLDLNSHVMSSPTACVGPIECSGDSEHPGSGGWLDSGRGCLCAFPVLMDSSHDGLLQG